MALKYFCDRCGKEFSSNNGLNGIAIIRRVGEDLSLGFKGMSLLCDECAEKFKMVKDRLKHEDDFFAMTDNDIALMEYDFKVGDRVVTSTGVAGVITDICNCERCKERGFYEPTVTTTFGIDTIWITDTCKNNGFINFYQIGKYKFGNIDIESVERYIKDETIRIEEAQENRAVYRAQLHRLKILKSFEDENKDRENINKEN